MEGIVDKAALDLGSGTLTLEELRMMLRSLPLNIDYVDENDAFRYYSNGDRLFKRSTDELGKNLEECHSEKSMPMVKEITGAFRKGRNEPYRFVNLKEGRWLEVRYIPLRDEKGDYKGILELSQDITEACNIKTPYVPPEFGELLEQSRRNNEHP